MLCRRQPSVFWGILAITTNSDQTVIIVEVYNVQIYIWVWCQCYQVTLEVNLQGSEMKTCLTYWNQRMIIKQYHLQKVNKEKNKKHTCVCLLLKSRSEVSVVCCCETRHRIVYHMLTCRESKVYDCICVSCIIHC